MTLEDPAIFMHTFMPPQRCLGLIQFPTASHSALEWFDGRVFEEMSRQVVLAAAGVRAVRAFEGFNALVNPNVFL